jgi:hypothetical protein
MKLKSPRSATAADQAIAGYLLLNNAAQPPRNVEQARVAYLTRRLRIAPCIAAVVAGLHFGEVRT